MHVSSAARQLLRPVGLTRDVPAVRLGAAVVASSLLVAVCAHVTVNLPFTPIPVTLSNFAVILVGLLLSPGAAFTAMMLYLVEGASGMPVFNPHGLGGIAQLLGPTGGYLLAYPFAAAIASWVLRASRRALPLTAAALVAGLAASAPIFIMGAGWLAILLHLSAPRALALGVTPFVPGECVKLLVAAGLLAALDRMHRLRSVS